MATLTEGQHTAEFLVSEANGCRSRESVTILSGQDLAAGTVCGKVASGLGRITVPTVVGTGDGVVATVFAGPQLEVGSYVATCSAIATHGGTFTIVTPSGLTLDPCVMTAGSGVSTPYVSDHLNFTITDGATDFAVGDVFTFVVSTSAPAVIGTGNGVISAITAKDAIKKGRYRFLCTVAATNGGTFELHDPDGDTLETIIITAGAGATAVFGTGNPQIAATITEGSTDFAVGDVFEVASFSPLGADKVVAWDPSPAAFDGREDAVGVLLGAVDASAADTAGVLIVRDAEVNTNELQWLTGLTTGQKDSGKAQLATRGIVSRTTL